MRSSRRPGQPVLVLVHSPIVGPDTWQPVADELTARGSATVVPTLTDDGAVPFWRQHTDAVTQAVADATRGHHRVVLVAHSGAGQLLGLVGDAVGRSGRRVAAYVFVDAALPPPSGQSRLAQLEEQVPGLAGELRRLWASGGGFPDWSDELLRPLVPDDGRRRRLRDGIRQQPAAYWDEPIPTPEGWPDAPCGVLLLSGTYEATAAAATARGWPVRRLDVDNHFHALADPAGVAAQLLDLSDALVAASGS